MACGCTSACGCDVQAGAGILVQRIGDTFIVSATGAGLITSVADTNCIDLDVTANVLTANIILDPDPSNQLTCGPNGLLSTDATVVRFIDVTKWGTD